MYQAWRGRHGVFKIYDHDRKKIFWSLHDEPFALALVTTVADGCLVAAHFGRDLFELDDA